MPPREARRGVQSMVARVAVGVFAFGLAMLGMNYYYASRCLSSGLQEGSYAELLERRLLAAETAVHRNSLLVDKLVAQLGKRLGEQEKALIEKLMQQSREQAEALSMELAKLPAPPLPDLSWTAEFEDPSKMGQMLDDAFEYAAYSEMKVQTDADQGHRRDGNRKSADDDVVRNWGDRYMDDDGKGKADVGEREGVEAEVQCQDWGKKYGVIPGTSWGRLPVDFQQKWRAQNCDFYV